MLVVMQAHATEEQVRAVCEKIDAAGYRAHAIPGAERTAIGITGNRGEVELGVEEMPGVAEVIRVTKPYKLVSRDVKQDNTVVRFGDSASIGGPELHGHRRALARWKATSRRCASPSRCNAAGAQLLRGGAFKPRTSPLSASRGSARKACGSWREVRRETGIARSSPRPSTWTAGRCREYADVIQIGARNMQNFTLLKRVGRGPSRCCSSAA